MCVCVSLGGCKLQKLLKGDYWGGVGWSDFTADLFKNIQRMFGWRRQCLLGKHLDPLEESLTSLTDHRLGVVAGNIVPFHSVSVEVVKNGQAVLVALTVVWLWRSVQSSV